MKVMKVLISWSTPDCFKRLLIEFFYTTKHKKDVSTLLQKVFGCLSLFAVSNLSIERFL